MASETFIARELFSCFWDIWIAGSLSDLNVRFPYDPQLRAFARRHETTWRELLLRVQDFCGFSAEVMTIADEAAPWVRRSSEPGYYTKVALTGHLLLASGSAVWTEVDYKNSEQLSAVLKDVVDVQLAKSIEGSLQGRYCFGPKMDSPLPPLKSVLGLRVTPVRGLLAADQDELRTAYQVWKARYFDEGSADVGEADDGYAEWLSTFAVPALDACD